MAGVVSSETVAGATTSLASVSFGKLLPALLALRIRPATKFAGDVLSFGEVGSASSESDLTSSAFFSLLNEGKKPDLRLSLGLAAGQVESGALGSSVGVVPESVATGAGSAVVSEGFMSSGLTSGSCEFTS
jgi:hypothetical protein